MATRAIKAQNAGYFAAWATLAAILAVGAGASMAAGLVNSLADAPTVAAAGDGLGRLARGDLFLLAHEIRGLALLAAAAAGPAPILQLRGRAPICHI